MQLRDVPASCFFVGLLQPLCKSIAKSVFSENLLRFREIRQGRRAST